MRGVFSDSDAVKITAGRGKRDLKHLFNNNKFSFININNEWN